MNKLKNIAPYIVIAILFVLLLFQNNQTTDIKSRLKELHSQNDSLALDIKSKQAQILELNSITQKFKEEIEKDLPSNIEFILHDTNKSGFFKFGNLKDKISTAENPKVYICGPAIMRESIIENAKVLK